LRKRALLTGSMRSASASAHVDQIAERTM
jgi:hypothetical protein